MDTEKLVHLIRTELPIADAIYLFGSQAGDATHAGSDLDIAILAKISQDPVLLWQISSKLADIAQKEVDLVDLRSASVVMQHQVVSKGLRLWQRDQEAEFFECTVFSSYWDWQITRRPLLDTIREQGSIYGR